MLRELTVSFGVKYEKVIFNRRYHGSGENYRKPNTKNAIRKQRIFRWGLVLGRASFQVTEETKEMVLQNICTILNNFLKCSAYENIIFCWVMHEQSIIDTILSHLNTEHCCVITISLLCSKEKLIQRLQKDVAAGLRATDVIERSVSRIALYENLNTIKIDTSDKSADKTAREIAAL